MLTKLFVVLYLLGLSAVVAGAQPSNVPGQLLALRENHPRPLC